MTKSRPPPGQSRAPDSMDRTVAKNIRRLRRSRGMTQATLAEHLGVTYQQIQKYEDATDRLAASRLWKCAQAFDVPVERLFQEDGPEDA